MSVRLGQEVQALPRPLTGLGLLGGEPIQRIFVTAGCETGLDECAGDLIAQPGDAVVPRGWQWAFDRRAMGQTSNEELDLAHLTMSRRTP